VVPLVFLERPPFILDGTKPPGPAFVLHGKKTLLVDHV
jgi:hypothetical protein